MNYFIVILFVILNGCTNNQINDEINNQKVENLLKRAIDRSNNFNLRRNISLKLLNQFLKEKNDINNREKLIKIGYNLIVLSDWDNFLIANNALKERSKESNDIKNFGISNRFYGIYFENKSKNDSAYFYYLKAEKIFNKINDSKQLCLINQDKAQVQFFINDYLGSEASLVNALKIAKKNNFIEDQYLIYSFLGVNSNELSDYNKSLTYHNKALNILVNNKDIFDNSDFAICYNNIGYNYMSTKNFAMANKFFEKGVDLKNLITIYPYIYCKLFENIVYLKLNTNDVKGVNFILNKINKTRKKYHIIQGQNFNRLYLSQYYAAVHDLPQANRYALEALNLSKSFKAPKDQLLCLKQLIKINPKQALAYSNQYIALSDSMQKMERQTRTKFAKIAFETEEITKEKEEVEEQNSVILAICVSIFIIAVLLFVIGRQLLKQKEFRLQQVQQKANEEIYNLLMEQQNKIDSARNNEKERISKDLHDGVLNRLASTRMVLGSLTSSPTPDNLLKSKSLIEGIQDVEKEIRNISHDLNKEVFSKSVSFVQVITTFMEGQYQATQTPNFLEFDANINWDLLPGVVKIHLYRIVQEAVHNTNKYAQANSIIINFIALVDGIRLEIFDDGVGFLLNKKKKGIGLQNIYSRTAACNGTAFIESKKGIGTTIKVFVPYQE